MEMGYFYAALAAVLLISGWWCISPLIRGRRMWFVGDAKSELETLMEERQMTLRTLKDLEAEHATGKLAEDVYERLREEAMRSAEAQTEAMELLRSKRSSAKQKVEAELAELIKAGSKSQSEQADSKGNQSEDNKKRA